MSSGDYKALQLREWRIMLIRNRGEFLDYVKAATRQPAAAETAAIRTFNLKQEDRKRLLVRERACSLPKPRSLL
jgi:hypothetical protein